MIPISSVFANLEATYTLFSEFILDRNYSQQPNVVGWPNYRPGISKQVYAKQYQDLISERQFSFLLIDGSAVQIHYAYDERGLKKVRLALYPVPKTVVVEPEQFDLYYDETISEVLESHYMLLHELMGQGVSVSNTTHVRFDYDRDVTSHSINHLQIDGIQEIRIPFKHLIMPFHFMDFLIKNMYNEDYKAMSSSAGMRYLVAASKGQRIDIPLDNDYQSIFISM